jgi:hypothetical protein
MLGFDAARIFSGQYFKIEDGIAIAEITAAPRPSTEQASARRIFVEYGTYADAIE